MTTNALLRPTTKTPKFDWGGSSDLAISYGASAETRQLINQVNAVESSRSTADAATPTAVLPGSTKKSTEEMLFDSLVEAKVYTSLVAMRMDKEWRKKLYRQLDSLLDIDEWDGEDEPLHKESFATFLKSMFLIMPKRRPGLGLSHGGNLIGMWTEPDSLLTMEFLAGDLVRLVLSRNQNGIRERAALDTEVVRLLDVLKPYSPETWFNNGDNKHS